MAGIHKLKYQDQIDAGYFSIASKPWMNGKTIWFWRKGSDPNAKIEGVFEKQSEAEEAAAAWWSSEESSEA